VTVKKIPLFFFLAVAFVFFWGGAEARAFSGENREFTPEQAIIVNSVFPGYLQGHAANMEVLSQRPLPPAPQPTLPPRPVETARPAPKSPEVRVASVPTSVKPAVPGTSALAAKPAELIPTPTAKPAPPVSNREVKTQYYLFDRRGPEEVGQLASRFRRESPGGMIVSDLQDASREYEVPKARFFREEYAVPTRELLDSSNALRMPDSPGYVEKK